MNGCFLLHARRTFINVVADSTEVEEMAWYLEDIKKWCLFIGKQFANPPTLFPPL